MGLKDLFEYLKTGQKLINEEREKMNPALKLTKEEVDFIKLFSVFAFSDHSYTKDIGALYFDSLKLLNNISQQGNDVSKYKNVNIKQLLGEIVMLSRTDIIPGTNFFEEFHHSYIYVKDRIESQRNMEIKRANFNSDLGIKKRHLAIDEEINTDINVELSKADNIMVKKSGLRKHDNLMLKYFELLLNKNENLAINPNDLYHSACLSIAQNKEHNKMLENYPRKTLAGEMLLLSNIRKVNFFELLKNKGYEFVESMLILENKFENSFKQGSGILHNGQLEADKKLIHISNKKGFDLKGYIETANQSTTPMLCQGTSESKKQ